MFSGFYIFPWRIIDFLMLFKDLSVLLNQSILIKHYSLYEKIQQDEKKDLSRQIFEIHESKLLNELEWPAMKIV